MVACQKFVTWASAIAAVIGATTAGLLYGQGAAHAASPATLSAAAFAPIKGLAVGKIASGKVMDGTWTLQPPLLCDDAAQAPPPAAQAKSQPGVTSDTVIGGLVIHVMNNSDDTTNCHYDSEVVDRDFTLQPRKNTDTSTTGRIFF